MSTDTSSMHANMHDERPWGSYDIVYTHVNQSGDIDTVVKILTVNPHAKLSYQSHALRAESWKVLIGTATIVCDGSEFVRVVGESIDIPLGAKHRLINDTDETLVLLEVGTGVYREDDIVRYEDEYGRA